jgi:hypothetical protein
MALKTTGKELKAFLADDSIWPDASDNNVFHEEVTLMVGGVERDSDYLSNINDDEAVTITGGYVSSVGLTEVDCTFEAYLKKWRKQQNTVYLSVSVPKDKAEAVKAAIKAAGGSC